MYFTSDSPRKDGQAVSFTNTTTGGTSPFGYDWDFGDGLGTSQQENPVYTYTAPGTYTVYFMVSDSNGCQDNTSGTVQVTASPILIHQNHAIDDSSCNGVGAQ